MAAIYLIRHGQASFNHENYDQLSPLGCEQAYQLGKRWQLKQTPDKVYSGDMKRHLQTFKHFKRGLNNDSLAVNSDSGFNEFDHHDVLKCYQPAWQTPNMFASYLKQQSSPKKAFQQAFTGAMQRWISGKFDDYVEPFEHFKQRCIGALEGVMQQHLSLLNTEQKKINNIIIFTSGGVISAVIQHILQCGDDNMMAVNKQLVNSNVTKLLFSKDRLSLVYLNNYSHLENNHTSLKTRI